MMFTDTQMNTLNVLAARRSSGQPGPFCLADFEWPRQRAAVVRELARQGVVEITRDEPPMLFRLPPIVEQMNYE